MVDPGAETRDVQLPVPVMRYGRDEALPDRHNLRAGPLRCVLESGALRDVTLVAADGSEQEVLRGVYAAVRDHTWGTVEPRFTRYEVEARDDSFAVRLTAEHRAGDVDFVWQGHIEGTAAGTINFTLDGLARASFLRNRIGFCVLHPMAAAGSAVEVEHTDGSVERGVFPQEISPHQPFFAIAALRQRFGGAVVEVRCQGDVFEMEDQRNWTDASYKTYCTPLAEPYPAQVAAGDRVQQQVTLRVLGLPAAALAARATPDGAPVAVTIGAQATRVLPPAGLQLAAHGQPPSAHEIRQLGALRPAHVWHSLDLTQPWWEHRLGQASAEAAGLDAALEIEARCADDGAGMELLAAALAAHPVSISAVHVYPNSGAVTTDAVIARARRAWHEHGLTVPLGGGSRADFVMANRAQLPMEQMDFLAFAVTPQVHAFDNASLMETLAAQRVVLQNAQRLAGGKPVRVGPVTLRQRFSRASAEPGGPAGAPGPPRNVDPRQLSLFGAAWTVGSLRHLAEGGAAALTYFETTGWLGVMERTAGFAPHPAFPSARGMRFPVYHALAAACRGPASPEREPDLIPVTIEPAGIVEALATGRGERFIRLTVANLHSTPQQVRVDWAGGALPAGTLRLLDERTYATAAAEVEASWRWSATTVPPGEAVTLDLLPYAIAFLEFEWD